MKQKVIVVKVGTKCIIENGKVKQENIDSIAREIARIKKEKGASAILVVSGAVELGKNMLDLKERPKEKIGLQRCAGVGQVELLKAWSDGLGKEGIIPSQYLLTYSNFESEEEQQNIIANLRDDIENGIVPVINFNDKIDHKEVTLDNDRLSSKIAVYARAEALFILTNDVGGLMDSEGLVRSIKLDDIERYKKLCNGAGDSGTGGMRTKLEAAQEIAEKGGICVIANVNCAISDLLSGYSECTRIVK
ncbi:MAG: hypothetical protein WC788_05170 [Candidatus Paceibacterota bacterium]|jgi:glutamate 5-kinase